LTPTHGSVRVNQTYTDNHTTDFTTTDFVDSHLSQSVCSQLTLTFKLLWKLSHLWEEWVAS